MTSKIILGIGAHPDDLDSACAGTIAKWVEEGATAYYLIATDGSKGTHNEKLSGRELIDIRRKEQKEAAKVIGVKEVFFLDIPDAELVPDMKLKKQLVKYIRKLKPDTVITLSPELYFKREPEDEGYVNHVDHRNLAVAVMDSIFPLSRDNLAFPDLIEEGLEPHKASELLMLNSKEPSFIVDISKTFDKKMEAMKCFKSQFEDMSYGFPWLEEANSFWGKKIGKKYAENFTRLGFW